MIRFMIRFLSTCLLTILFTISTEAQEPLYKTYKWESTPKIHEASSSESTYMAYVVQDHGFSQLEAGYGSAYTYYTEHKIIHVNSHAGIEKYNKVYIPLKKSGKLVNLQVR